MTEDQAAQLLRSRKAEDRVRAVGWLARQRGPQEMLLEALRDRVPYVAAMAAEALCECADEASAQDILQRFEWLSEHGAKRDPGCHTRAHLALALGRLEYYPAAEALRRGIRTKQIEVVGHGLYDTADHLRAHCALALAQMSDRHALPDIAVLLFDHGNNAIDAKPSDPALGIECRLAAARALARLGDPAGIAPLTVRLRFPAGEDVEVLMECMQALVELGAPDAVETLRPYLEHEDENLVAHTAVMLARSGDEQAPALIRKAAENLQGAPLRAALLALASMRDDSAVFELCDMAENGREVIRLAVVEALAHVAGEQARHMLVRLCEDDPSADVRAAAMAARRD